MLYSTPARIPDCHGRESAAAIEYFKMFPDAIPLASLTKLQCSYIRDNLQSVHSIRLKFILLVDTALSPARAITTLPPFLVLINLNTSHRPHRGNLAVSVTSMKFKRITPTSNLFDEIAQLTQILPLRHRLGSI
jgi:hypothetical protein